MFQLFYRQGSTHENPTQQNLELKYFMPQNKKRQEIWILFDKNFYFTGWVASYNTDKFFRFQNAFQLMLLLRRKLKKMLLIHKVLGKIEAWVDRINVVLLQTWQQIEKREVGAKRISKTRQR